MARSEIVGMAELLRDLGRLERAPQAVASKSARAGASIALRAARRNAPADTGELKRGLKLKGERRTKPGKKVYDVMVDPAKNALFVKVSKAGKRSYYPASQEYGFITASGQYIPGFNYLKNAITDNSRQIGEKTVEVARREVEKILTRR